MPRPAKAPQAIVELERHNNVLLLQFMDSPALGYRTAAVWGVLEWFCGCLHFFSRFNTAARKALYSLLVFDGPDMIFFSGGDHARRLSPLLTLILNAYSETHELTQIQDLGHRFTEASFSTTSWSDGNLWEPFEIDRL